MVSELLCILFSVYDFMTVAIDIIKIYGEKLLNSLKDKTELTSKELIEYPLFRSLIFPRLATYPRENKRRLNCQILTPRLI